MFRKTYYGKLLYHFAELKAMHRKNIVHLITSAILRTLAFLLIPLMASKIIGAIEIKDFESAVVYILLFAASAIFYVVCHHYNYWAYYVNANDIHNTLQQHILEKVVEFDANFTASIPKATLVSTAFADVDEVRKVPDFFCDTVAHIVGIVANVVILCVVDLMIGLIAAILLLISVLIFIRHTKKRDYYRMSMREQSDNLSGLYSQIIDGYKEVQTLNLRDDLAEYLAHTKESWKKYHIWQRFHRDFAAGAVPFVIGAGRVLIYLICVTLILQGKYTIAALVLVLGYYEDIINRYDRICDAVDNVSRSSVAIERLHRLLRFKTIDMIEFGKNNEDDICGEVEFRHVFFSYAEPPKKAPDGTLLEMPVKKAPKIRDISFKVQPKSLTAIVGKSGSGKSTIFRLLLRLYKISSGEILLDGENIYDYTRDVYATNVSIVSQKPFVFDMSIRENLNLVNKNIGDQEVACKKVGIHDDIMKLEDGYDTILRRDAENLSAGQKQLLALARVLLSRSEVLLFDEITSNLDAATAEKVVTILQKLKKDHTVIMVTHNPELMKMADNILVVDKGKIAAEGNHKKLLRDCEVYKELQKR